MNIAETASAAPSEHNLIWVDLEMTGLDPDKDLIIEVAVVVTDSDLRILAQSQEFAVRQSTEVMETMDPWCIKTHGKSGLTARVLASTFDAGQVEQKLLEFLAKWVPPKKSPMCGNSICQDRRFMARGMPSLEAYLHYRNLDVSTLKELCKRWSPQLACGHTKKGAHTALSDILESIEELRYYREHFIVKAA